MSTFYQRKDMNSVSSMIFSLAEKIISTKWLSAQVSPSTSARARRMLPQELGRAVVFGKGFGVSGRVKVQGRVARGGHERT